MNQKVSLSLPDVEGEEKSIACHGRVALQGSADLWFLMMGVKNLHVYLAEVTRSGGLL